MLKKYTGLIIAVALSCLFTASSVMASSTQCLKCHQDVRNNATAKMVVHAPFSQDRCELCHSAGPDNKINAEPGEQNRVISDTNEKKRMEWLAESFVKNTQQVALLPADVCGTELTIKLWYQNHKKQQSTIRCPDLNSIPIQLNSPQPPTISQLHLRSYTDQLFSRATLNWITDAPCRCQLLYRSDNHEYAEHEDDFYTVDHNLEIRNFNPDNTEISIQCVDTFQQHVQSEYIPLATLTLQVDKNSGLQPDDSTDFLAEFKRSTDFIEISIITSQPAAISLGRVEQKKEPLPEPQQVQKQNEPVILETGIHPSLADEKQLNTTVCLKCHRSTVEIASHPINVLPPPGMIIPPEYPLLSNGRLTCMTCHNHHSSNNEARLLKEGKKELCTGCHVNY